jgi:DNA-binding protein YbaB
MKSKTGRKEAHMSNEENWIGTVSRTLPGGTELKVRVVPRGNRVLVAVHIGDEVMRTSFYADDAPIIAKMILAAGQRAMKKPTAGVPLLVRPAGAIDQRERLRRMAEEKIEKEAEQLKPESGEN